MAKSMDIPQDIIDNVIAAVGDNTRLLKQCSLVSSSFLIPSRKRLFSKIIIRNDEICEGIHQLLIENSFIQPCVRSITINGSTYFGWVNSRSLLVILQLPLCCIENFAIILPRIEGQLWDSMDWNHDSDAWDWNYFGDEMRGVLWNIMLSSTLKTLCLSGISNLPISFFLHVAPLSVLELDSLSPNDFHEDYSSLLTQTPSDGAIDLCVWRFEDEHMRYHTTIQWKFLPFVCRLRRLEICIDLNSGTDYDFHILSIFMLSLSISLSAPSVLQHLEFHIRFFDPDFNFFLDNVRNIWSPFDFVTTLPTTSFLQEVNINIEFLFHYDDEVEPAWTHTEISQAVYDGLPLLQTRHILYVNSTLEELSDSEPSYDGNDEANVW